LRQRGQAVRERPAFGPRQRADAVDQRNGRRRRRASHGTAAARRDREFGAPTVVLRLLSNDVPSLSQPVEHRSGGAPIGHGGVGDLIDGGARALGDHRQHEGLGRAQPTRQLGFARMKTQFT